MAQDGGGLTTSPSTTFGEPLAGAPGSTLASAACAPVCVIFSMASPIVATCARFLWRGRVDGAEGDACGSHERPRRR